MRIVNDVTTGKYKLWRDQIIGFCLLSQEKDAFDLLHSVLVDMNSSCLHKALESTGMIRTMTQAIMFCKLHVEPVK